MIKLSVSRPREITQPNIGWKSKTSSKMKRRFRHSGTQADKYLLALQYENATAIVSALEQLEASADISVHVENGTPIVEGEIILWHFDAKRIIEKSLRDLYRICEETAHHHPRCSFSITYTQTTTLSEAIPA